MKFILEINKGIFPFLLGEKIDPYLLKHSYEFEMATRDSLWDEYDFYEGDIEVYVDKGTKIIESICCRVNCYLNDKNLVGMLMSEFLEMNLIKNDYAIDKIELSDDVTRDVYDFQESGLQLWVNNGKIEAVFI